jgi:hypothetical protein
VSASKDLDPQRLTVYAFEDSWPGWNKNHIGINACRKVIYHACDDYKVDRPKVQVHHVRSLSYTVPSESRISLQGWAYEDKGALNVAIALHEAAHHIAHTRHGDRIQDHGPTWLGLYLDLLIKARVAPEVALKASLRSFGLKWRSV